MVRRNFILLATALSLAAIYVPAAPGAQAAAPEAVVAASLTITPEADYVGGQGLHWTGNIGVSGVRNITMQRFLGREGDAWEDVEYFSAYTDAAGDFAYWYPAPAMRSILYRVVSGPVYLTPSVEIYARQPDLILWVTGGDPDDPEDIGSAVATEQFGISVDTTPALFRRSDTERLQPIPGRELTLQRRVAGTGDKWDTLDHSVVGEDGMGYFTGVTESQPGEVVYRVRQEDWKEDHSDIGWFPSFPTYVTISAPGAEAGPAMAPPGAPTFEADGDAEVLGPDGSGGSAAGRYDWFPMHFDFAWERGESLTSPPWRGLAQEGWWLDYSDGGGRVSKDGGGLTLDSKRENRAGEGDFGTTKATMQDNPLKFGRWETKLLTRSMEVDGEDYSVRLELVPDRAQGDVCRTITIAEFTAQGSTVNFGANAHGKKWTGSEELGLMDFRLVDFAIEVAPDHITWFIDTEPVGTVKTRKAISRVPLTMRLAMVGDGQSEMNRIDLKSDWQRGFTLARGEQITSGAPLVRKGLTGC